MKRCSGCGRFRVTERQLKRWCLWCWRDGDYWKPRVGFYASVGKRAPWWFRMRRRQPWWFRWSLECMGWYDCPGEYALELHGVEVRVTRYERRCLRRVAS